MGKRAVAGWCLFAFGCVAIFAPMQWPRKATPAPELLALLNPVDIDLDRL